MKKQSEERPKKNIDDLTEEEKALFRTIKWSYYMSKSCLRACEGTKRRNLNQPEFASKEAFGLFEGQAKAYGTIIQKLIKDLNLPSINEILKLHV